MLNVFILTFCRNRELFYGTKLIFKTLRTGFPNARVTVVDNASIPETVDEIRVLAEGCDCRFKQLTGKGTPHHTFIEKTLHDCASNEFAHEPLIFLDPDMCFWRSCEDFDFSGLIAGRRVPRFNCMVTNTITMPRLHTSFLWIPDPKKLMQEIWRIKVARFDFEPFLSCSFALDGTWYRYDTGANLYAALSHKVNRFTEYHFDCFDHILCGSHLDWVYDKYDGKIGKMMTEVHKHAKAGNLAALKGIWKYQDDVFSKYMINP